MIAPWLLSGLGLVILLLAGDALVKGAVNLSLRVGIPALIVSLTIVAFGTSAPELLIGVNAVLEGKPGLALGNVVGSNTANILLVLGVPALLAGLHTSSCSCQKTFVFMIAATVLFIALAFRGVFDFTAGLILLAALAYVLLTLSGMRKNIANPLQMLRQPARTLRMKKRSRALTRICRGGKLSSFCCWASWVCLWGQTCWSTMRRSSPRPLVSVTR